MKKYVHELDGLRGAGMIFVLMAHFNLKIVDYNWIAIQSFFVLSGYLISGILIEQKKKQGTFKEKFKVYWVRRALRIFPVYYLYLIILGISYIIFTTPNDYLDNIIYLATYTFNFTKINLSILHSETLRLCIHLWSLSVEEQFYLILPILVFIFSNKSLKFITLFFIIFSPVFRYFFAEYLFGLGKDEHEAGDVLYQFTLSHCDALFLGVAINIFNILNWKHLKTYLLLWLLLLLSVGLINYTLQTNDKSLTDYLYTLGYFFVGTKNYQHVWSYSIVNIFFMLLISVLVANSVNPKSYLNRLFNFKLFTSLGRVSYSMYVYHLLILTLLNNFIFPSTHYGDSLLKQSGWFIIYVAVVYVAGLISFRFFETPFLKLKPNYLGTKTSGTEAISNSIK